MSHFANLYRNSRRLVNQHQTGLLSAASKAKVRGLTACGESLLSLELLLLLLPLGLAHRQRLQLLQWRHCMIHGG